VRWLTAFAVALTGVFVLSTGLEVKPTQCCFGFYCHVIVSSLLHEIVQKHCHGNNQRHGYNCDTGVHGMYLCCGRDLQPKHQRYRLYLEAHQPSANKWDNDMTHQVTRISALNFV